MRLAPTLSKLLLATLAGLALAGCSSTQGYGGGAAVIGGAAPGADVRKEEARGR